MTSNNSSNELENLFINTLRLLSADCVQKANSGHPGLPLGAAPMAYALWDGHMAHNPNNSAWPNRDRFVLSAGHGSALLYSLLHLFGYGLSLDDMRNFRQWGSATPGHPEYNHTKGVEITTGPLGQGVANAVGMAWAQSYMAAVHNRPNFPIIDHYTYVLCGDGCLQEGIASEAASLAGTLKLGKLIMLYDSNNITIEGDTATTFTEDVLARHEAYGWHVQKVECRDVNAIKKAIENAKNVTDAPSLIEIKTQIGHGAPNKAGTAAAHGEPLGKDELAATKAYYGFDPNKDFFVPSEVAQKTNDYKACGQKLEDDWNKLLADYKAAHPGAYNELMAWHDKNLPNFEDDEDFWACYGDIATRAASEKVLNKIAEKLPNLIGGAADLAPSTKTTMSGRGSYTADNPIGANLQFGVREHAMAAIANGMAVYGGLRPYVSGFFVFSDYAKPAMRLSALMGLPVINIFTHDSIGVGEDGPTHQPIEQLAALRSIPGFTVIRPADSKEVAAAWLIALKRKNGPTAIILSRQNTKALANTGKDALKGAYVLVDSKKALPDIILMATGTEVNLALKANELLAESGVDARVVSMPCWEVFEEQPDDYKDQVLPKAVRARLAIEAASDFGWHRYVGLDGDIVAINGFGQSAPADRLFAEYGFSAESVAGRALKLLGK